MKKRRYRNYIFFYICLKYILNDYFFQIIHIISFFKIQFSEVIYISIVAYNENEVKLLARLMRAEAEGEGELGMLMVGNVGINRVLANCLDFKDIRTIEQMVFQRPGGFESTLYSYFYQPARQVDIKLARRSIKGERYDPATRALWFYSTPTPGCQPTWFNQWNSGKYKSHCFYAPVESYNCY